jgi:hypothetical protein
MAASSSDGASLASVEVQIPAEMASWVQGDDQKVLAAAVTTANAEEQKLMAAATAQNTSAVAA